MIDVSVIRADHVSIMATEVICGLLCGIVAYAVLYMKQLKRQYDVTAKLSILYVVVFLFILNIFGDQMRAFLFARTISKGFVMFNR